MIMSLILAGMITMAAFLQSRERGWRYIWVPIAIIVAIFTVFVLLLNQLHSGLGSGLAIVRILMVLTTIGGGIGMMLRRKENKKLGWVFAGSFVCI